MSISTIALIVFFLLYGISAIGLIAIPPVVMGIVALVVAVALMLGR